ncbi:MAG: GFA family protein [Proteobacteria bacterium]|nr:GFA family protein [Pseudomonadota bacterium]
MCGDIQYDVEGDSSVTGICHCPDCKRQTGSAFSTIVGVGADQIVVEGTPRIYKTKGISGEGVLRHFCGNCGSPLYSVVNSMPGVAFIKAGTLDDTSWLVPTIEFFCDNADIWTTQDVQRQKFGLMPPG